MLESEMKTKTCPKMIASVVIDGNATFYEYLTCQGSECAVWIPGGNIYDRDQNKWVQPPEPQDDCGLKIGELVVEHG